jgi:hypothetical protein
LETLLFMFMLQANRSAAKHAQNETSVKQFMIDWVAGRLLKSSQASKKPETAAIPPALEADAAVDDEIEHIIQLTALEEEVDALKTQAAEFELAALTAQETETELRATIVRSSFSSAGCSRRANPNDDVCACRR